MKHVYLLIGSIILVLHCISKLRQVPTIVPSSTTVITANTSSPSPHVVIWKSSISLPDDAIPSLQTWNATPLKVVDDRECRALAHHHKCYGYDRPDIMNIMRADACRYMALYAYGGIYTDLDVDLKIPFGDHCKGLCVGREHSDKDTLANFCFMAPQFDSCLLRAIQLCCDNLRNVKMDFKADPHLIHSTCGPSAFTKAVSSCVYHVWPHKLFYSHIKHWTASNKWSDYPSWIKERQERAGWKTVYEDGKKTSWSDWVRHLFH